MACYGSEDGITVFYRVDEKGEILVELEMLEADGRASVANVLKRSLVKGKDGEVRILYGIDSRLPYIAAFVCVSGTSADCQCVGESYRVGAAVGFRCLSECGVRVFYIESGAYTREVTEGHVLASYEYKKYLANEFRFLLLDQNCGSKRQYQLGLMMGEAQNLTRYLAESPANVCTPNKFCEFIRRQCDKIKNPNLKVTIYGRDVIENEQMGLFLSVARGSEEEPRLLVLEYRGAEGECVALVGKGVTFDSGGISIKPAHYMCHMKKDMTGGAMVASAVMMAAAMSLETHVVAIIPLTENMPSGKATKPGDVVVASNGKSVEVKNTDAEGRLILADCLLYAQKRFTPSLLVDVATLTGAMKVALGTMMAGAYTPCDQTFTVFAEAGMEVGDHIWRMPLSDLYHGQLKSMVADISNVDESGQGAGSNSAALFLKEFVQTKQWIHLDIAGLAAQDCSKLFSSGRPTGQITRLLLEVLLRKAGNASWSVGSDDYLKDILHHDIGL